jgi:predicted enzyme related to lactoylglutathione lyase/uncharacterized protein YndB with AHSA1/START domain
MNKFFLVLFYLVHFSLFSQMELSTKKIVKSKVFCQSIDSIWNKWTTHEGLKTFFGADNKIELIPNGAFEIYFLMDAPVGIRGSETCKVLSFIPNRQFSFTWNVPPQFAELRKSPHRTWVVLEFISTDKNYTNVILTHLGWPKDENWNPVFDYFNSAWDQVFESLSKHDEKQKNPPRIVTGIGGLFFKCKDPEIIKEWYKKHLGLNTDQYGSNFEWRQALDPNKKGFTQWSPFKETTKYFDPSTKDFMINYRVENIESLIEKLTLDGVTILDKLETYDYGKFIHILDVEGNKIELWEPVDEVYDAFDGGRTK